MSKLSSRTALIPVFTLGAELPVQVSESTVVSAAADLIHHARLNLDIAFSVNVEAV
jgi:hypothetical protein